LTDRHGLLSSAILPLLFSSDLSSPESLLMIRYQKGEGVRVTSLGRRPVFVTPQGGRIASDPRLTALWEGIDGQSLEEILDRARESGESKQETLGALVCLAEAGLIRRDPPPGTPEAGTAFRFWSPGFRHHRRLQQPRVAGRLPPFADPAKLFSPGNHRGGQRIER